MKRFAIITCLAALPACTGIIEEPPAQPADAAAVASFDAGFGRDAANEPDAEMPEAAPDAATEQPLPPCRNDPFRTAAADSFELADWLVGGSPCAHVAGLPASGFVGDETLYDEDDDGYLEYSRNLPAGIYSLRLSAMDCRTHGFGEPAVYDGGDLSQVRREDRDPFYCWGIPIINCIDWGNGVYECWTEKVDYFCEIRLEVLEDGAVRGAGGNWDALVIAQRCQ